MLLKIAPSHRTPILVALIPFVMMAAAHVSCAGDAHEGVVTPAIEASSIDDRLQGRVLLEELGCVACHGTDSSLATLSKVAPRLSAVATRVNPNYLERFIQNTHAVKPGTTMPDVMQHLPDDERREAAQAITHYLLSHSGKSQSFALHAIDAVAAEEGKKLFHSVGCVACHSPRNELGQELMAENSVPLGDLDPKYNTHSLVLCHGLILGLAMQISA